MGIVRLKGNPVISNNWEIGSGRDVFVSKENIEFAIKVSLENRDIECLFDSISSGNIDFGLALDTNSDILFWVGSNGYTLGEIGIIPKGVFYIESIGIDITTLNVSKISIFKCMAFKAIGGGALSKIFDMADFVDEMSDKEYKEVMNCFECKSKMMVYIVRIGLKNG